jgi:hypothetical protein
MTRGIYVCLYIESFASIATTTTSAVSIITSTNVQIATTCDRIWGYDISHSLVVIVLPVFVFQFMQVLAFLMRIKQWPLDFTDN